MEPLPTDAEELDVPVDLDAVRRTLRAHGVVFALLFGSYASGTARPDSDVDVAVWSDRPIDHWRLGGASPDAVDVLDSPTRQTTCSAGWR